MLIASTMHLWCGGFAVETHCCQGLSAILCYSVDRRGILAHIMPTGVLARGTNQLSCVCFVHGHSCYDQALRHTVPQDVTAVRQHTEYGVKGCAEELTWGLNSM